jgi:hypothetical protein
MHSGDGARLSPTVFKGPGFMPDIEFIRNCFVLVPDGTGDAGIETIYVSHPGDKGRERTFCSCVRGRSYASCTHGKALLALHARLLDGADCTPTERFKEGAVYQMLKACIMHGEPAAASVRIANGNRRLTGVDSRGAVIFIHTGDGGAAERLRSRLCAGEGRGGSRSDMVNKAREFALTDAEKELLSRGAASARLKEEDGLWFRLAYHCHRENGGGIRASIDTVSGILQVTIAPENGAWEITAHVPRVAAFETIRCLLGNSRAICDFTPEEGEGEILFRINALQE